MAWNESKQDKPDYVVKMTPEEACQLLYGDFDAADFGDTLRSVLEEISGGKSFSVIQIKVMP